MYLLCRFFLFLISSKIKVSLLMKRKIISNMKKESQKNQNDSQEISEASSSVSQTFIYFIDSWKKYFLFSGRANRTMFWAFVFFNIVIGSFIALVVGRQGAVVYFFLSFFPAWSAAVRRLRDAGQSGLWSVIPILLFCGSAYFVHTGSSALNTLFFSLGFISSALLIFFLCLKSETLKSEKVTD